MAPAGHRGVEGKADGLRRKPHRLSRSSRTRPPRATRRRHDGRGRGWTRRRTSRRRTGSRRQTGRGVGRGAGRRESGARPRVARRTTGARMTGHGTASGRWRRGVGAGRGGDQRVGASGRDGRVNGCAGGRGYGDGDVRRGAGWLRRRQPPTMRGEESKIEIQNQNALRSSSPLTPRRSRLRAYRTKVPYLRAGTIPYLRLSVQRLGAGGTSPA